jgi:quercetin dioxygenase-like cupin family protein
MVREVQLRDGGLLRYDCELTSREKVEAFEVLAKQEPQVDIPTKHYFSKGIYAREIFIPAGTILTGHIHKYQNLNIISKGKIEVLVGDHLEIIEAPYTIVSPPGTKRIARAIEDTVWTTIHGTEETDVNLIEEIFICKTEAEYLEFEKQLQLPLMENHGGY